MRMGCGALPVYLALLIQKYLLGSFGIPVVCDRLHRVGWCQCKGSARRLANAGAPAKCSEMGLGSFGMAPDTSGAAIFQAVKDLGLELQSRKAPVETIIVDHVEKAPTAN